MQKTMKRQILLAAVTSCVAVSSSPAYALPFAPNVKSFTSYLNSLSWDDGKERIFSGLRKCEHVELPSMGLEAYDCDYAYVKIKDPIRGTIFCEITAGYGDNNAVYYNSGFGGDNPITKFSNPGPCKRM